MIVLFIKRILKCKDNRVNLLLLLMISSKRIVPSVDKIIVVLWINVLSFNVSWCPHRGSDDLIPFKEQLL